LSTAPRRLGKYELQVLLGRGGMAEVWKALDTQLQRYVAIKLMHANLQADPDFITRFTREAQIIAALRHPNIVQIYDFHISEGDEAGTAEADTLAYMVMEYIKGSTLAHYIYNTSRKKQFPSATEIIRLFTPISLAIDYAHQQGMIHRDIKPANILLDQTHTARNPMGEPILSDFGLAKLLNTASQTVTGTLLGTPQYISPEQVQNRPVSKQTDIYALGTVLYEIFTGEPLFKGESLTGIMMQHLLEMPTEPHLVNPNLPPALSQVLLKSLAKNPADRFSNAAVMTAGIAEALSVPLPEDLQLAIVSTEETNPSEDATAPLRSSSSSLAATVISSSSVSSDGSLVVAPDAATVVSEGSVLSTLPPGKVEAISSPIHLPDSETQLSMEVEKAVDLTDQSAASDVPVDEPPTVVAQTEPDEVPARVSEPSATSIQTKPEAATAPVPASLPDAAPVSSSEAPPVLPAPPLPASQKRRRLQIALVAVLICVLLGSGLGTFLLLSHRSVTAPVVASSIVGQASFVSSGQVDMTTNLGNNDEFQINLRNIPAPQTGESYYGWLLPDKSQSEAAPILLGKASVDRGTLHLFYSGDSAHTNLLDMTSRFLITEESASTTPVIPSPDLSRWRYYAEIPQTPAAGQTYSLLDHLRHLLSNDPTLEAAHLQGGLNIWAYRNTQSIMDWAGSANDAWNKKDFTSVHRQVVSILDYLDGTKLVQEDVPSGTPIFADPQIAQVGLLEIKRNQDPPGYIYHIDLHLNGVLTSPGATQYQRNLAIQINAGINNVDGWLVQIHHDAIQLARMNDTQLALPSSLALLKDMATQANNAYKGHIDSSTGHQQIGVTQVFRLVQQLASFEVKPYK